MAVTRSDFTDAMRQFPAAVNIVTTGSGDNRAGFTATAVMSLTADPPQVGVAVNKSTRTHPQLCVNGSFCINTLPADHNALARRFAERAEGMERFDQGEWDELATGAPALRSALLNLDCTVADRLELSTHTLFVGRIEAIRKCVQHKPLLFMDGVWASLFPGLDVDIKRFASGVEQSLGALEDATRQNADATQQLDAVVRDLTQIYVSSRDVMEEFRLAEIFVPTAMRDELNDAKKRFDRRLAQFLAEGTREGKFILRDATLAAFAIEGMVAWVHRWFRPGGRLSSDEVGSQLAELARRMVAPWGKDGSSS